MPRILIRKIPVTVVGEGGPMYPGYGNITEPSTGCRVFGLSIPCDWLTQFSFGHLERVFDVQRTPPIFGSTPVTVGQVLREGINDTPLGKLLNGNDLWRS